MAPSNELKRILDEVEKVFSAVRICRLPCPDCAIALTGLALVKALRRAVRLAEWAALYPTEDTCLAEITAILNQGRKDKKELGKPEGNS